MGCVSGGNSLIKNNTLYKQDCDSNNVDASSGHFVINSHNLSQFYVSSTFKEIYGDVDNGDVSSGYGSMNSHTLKTT